jgi:metallo-beta-lactamase family protein
LLHINGKKVLLDCGLFQGRRKASDFLNRHFPFDASEIDAVVLSHAHIDHAGALPLLVKQGFTGLIYCTYATRDLCSIMLPDSAYIQEKDYEWMSAKQKKTVGEPLYTIEDAEKTLTYFRSVQMEQKFSPVPGMSVRFLEAGHVLGSAMVEMEIDDKDTGVHLRLGFTGDLGRKDLPILKDPDQMEGLDALITESTYGGRLHDELIDIEDQVAHSITQTVAKNGKIIIPAFAVGRTQEVLFVLKELQRKGKLPELPIFVDSPLAQKATKIFQIHPETFDAELRVMLEKGIDPFCECRGVKFTKDAEESKALNDFPGSCIILSASGMCEAGRIRHHLVNNISGKNNMILSVGFMAENTLGRKIIEKQNPINIFGEPHQLNCQVENYRAFSGHADQKGLLDFAENCGSPKTVFMVHGEAKSMLTFKEKMEDLPNLNGSRIVAPQPGCIWELQPDKSFKKMNIRNKISAQYCDLLDCESFNPEEA